MAMPIKAARQRGSTDVNMESMSGAVKDTLRRLDGAQNQGSPTNFINNQQTLPRVVELRKCQLFKCRQVHNVFPHHGLPLLAGAIFHGPVALGNEMDDSRSASKIHTFFAVLRRAKGPLSPDSVTTSKPAPRRRGDNFSGSVGDDQPSSGLDA